jgi:hypothetical protein
MHLCPRFIFPSKFFFFDELLRGLVGKKKHLYVLPILPKCHYATTSFDLWISKGGHDGFTLVINFLGVDWQPNTMRNHVRGD